MTKKQMTRWSVQLACCVLAVFAPWGASPASAACTGSHPTWTSTPDQASVASCVSSAASGATINVSAGSAAWSTPIAIVDKNLTIIGAGAGSTVISTRGFNLSNSASRISAFTFNLGTGNYMTFEGSRGFRIDHNTIAMPGWDFCLFAIGSFNGTRSNTPAEGLIDNNTLTNCRIIAYGEYQDTGGKDRWSEPYTPGDVHSIYVEDNVYTITDPACTSGGTILCNFVDHNVGGKYVARFNTINDSYFEGHSLQSGSAERGGRAVEIYNNALNCAGCTAFSRPYFMRGGTGMIFHNVQNKNYAGNFIDFDNVRTCENRGVPFGQCDGTSFIDGNNDSSGWACRDQIGRSTDASFWDFSSPAPSQASAPFYVWRNTSPAGELTVSLNSWAECSAAENARMAQQIMDDRDYFQYEASFTGTSGVGEGTLASRPATCTTGVGYWATDQGEGNSRLAGPDGQLYRCTAPDTWTLNYTPFPYPHPLQSISGMPTAPSNLRIVP